MNAAITSNMRNLMTVVKAVNKFKALTASKNPRPMTSILGDQQAAHFSQPPLRIRRKPVPLPNQVHKSRSEDTFDRPHREGELVAEGVHRDLSAEQIAAEQGLIAQIPANTAKAYSDAPKANDLSDSESDNGLERIPTGEENEPIDFTKLPPFRTRKAWPRRASEAGQRGHARDPLGDQLYLFIGPSTYSAPGSDWDRRSSFVPNERDVPIVSESPGAADVDIYETAYRDEVERILARAKEEEKEPDVYLTRRMDEKLFAISGWAGRRMAGAEEVARNVDYYTQFNARRARVTEVSRALRHAARDEYDRRRKEKRTGIAQAKAEKAKSKEEAAGENTTSDARPLPLEEEELPPQMSSRESWRMSGSAFRGIAADTGKQAKTTFRGLVDAVKSRTTSRDEAS